MRITSLDDAINYIKRTHRAATQLAAIGHHFLDLARQAKAKADEECELLEGFLREVGEAATEQEEELRREWAPSPPPP
jgi:hypothetical protein